MSDVPTNPATGEPFFTVGEAGWGGGWKTGPTISAPLDQLHDRSRDACAEMLRYGNTVADENILAVLEALTDLNDNVANGRAAEIVRADVARIKALLDAVAAEARG